MRNPRETFEERSNPEGVAQRVTAGVSISPGQLCHPFGVRFDFAPIPGVARALRAPPPAIYVSPLRGFAIFPSPAWGGQYRARVERKAPNGADNIARGWNAKPRIGRTISGAGGTQSPEWGGTYIAGGRACEACGTPGKRSNNDQTPKGWHNGSQRVFQHRRSNCATPSGFDSILRLFRGLRARCALHPRL